MTQKERILELFEERGEDGVYNWEFYHMSPPILQPCTRMFELRKLGHNILTKHVTGGTYKFILED